MARKQFLLSALVGSVLFYTGVGLRAQEIVAFPKDKNNFYIEAVTNVPLRKKPPNYGYIFISNRDEVIAVINKGEKVKVRDKKILKTFFGDDIWVKVRRTEQEKKIEGWSYFGSEGLSPHFRLVEEKKEEKPEEE
jgi:hypothetical protein